MTRLLIDDGPSKWHLILALFDGDSKHRRPVTFNILGSPDPRLGKPEYRVTFSIENSGRTESSAGRRGHEFSFKAICIENKGGFKIGQEVSGLYLTTVRTGLLNIPTAA